MRDSALELRDIDAGYGDRTVLRGLRVRFPWGRITAVLGPGSSGKSTLLKVLDCSTADGLWSTGNIPTVDAWRLPQPRLGGESPQDLEWAQDVLERWARSVGLSFTILCDALRTSPNLFVHVAHMLRPSAEVLLLDEPGGSATPAGLAALTAVLRRSSMEGRTIVLATRDLRLARRVADHGIMLVDGDKVDEGSPARLGARPSGARVRAFLASGA